MTEVISQEQRNQLSQEGSIVGERKKLKMGNMMKSVPKAVEPAPAPQVNNRVNVDLDPIVKSQAAMTKALQQNTEVMQALLEHLKTTYINNKQEEKVNTKTNFRVKRDSRGMIEGVEVE